MRDLGLLDASWISESERRGHLPPEVPDQRSVSGDGPSRQFPSRTKLTVCSRCTRSARDRVLRGEKNLESGGKS